MKVMGIDPATLTGICYELEPGMVHLETVNIKPFEPKKRRKYSTEEILELKKAQGVGRIRDCLEEASHHGVELAYVEDVYMGLNVKTLKVLVEIRTRWMVAAEFCGIETRSVTAQTWKTAQLTFSGKLPQGRDAQKEASMWFAKHGLKLDPKDDNQSDAACIWDWGKKMQRLEALEA